MRMKKLFDWLVPAAALVGLLATVSPAQAEGRIRHRHARQQHRIADGIRSGALTAREAARLERREARVNRDVRRMRLRHGGRLTRRDRLRIERRQDRLSRDIHRQKHDRQKRGH